MGKIKKSVIAAKRASKQAQHQKTIANNPFEVRVNKKKYEILGRKMKHERGLPGVSRSKALKKRQNTLLVEYKQRNKANVFVDKRFGENDSEMTLEDKLLKRFAIEKQKHHEKAGIYSLEEEELTHLGQSLGDLDKFDDVRLSDSEDEINEGDDVAETHFGGFLKKKSDSNDNEEPKPKTRKEIMEEVVAKAKLKKHERQKTKEENTNMTDLLDQDWKDIRNLMAFRDHNSKQETTKPDDYDIAVKELAYEAKGMATNRLKTEIEIAKEEQEKLKALEGERIRRMKGIAIKNKPMHISADDLGDSFSIKEDVRTMLSYDDGKVNLPDGEETLSYEWLKGDAYGKSGGSESEESEEENNNEDDNDEEESDAESDSNDDDDNGDDDDDGDDNDNDDDDAEDVEDSGEDLNADNESEDEIVEPMGRHAIVKKPKTTQDKQKTKKKTDKELPFTFIAPQSYDEFKKLISNWPEKDHITIIERIKTCNHPKISPENKSKMEKFLAILLQYVGELSEQDPPALKTVDTLTKLLFDVAQFSPVHSCQCMQHIIKEAHCKYTQEQEQRGGRAVFPELETLLYLRLVSTLFPMSDLKHCVCTSAMIFISQILAQAQVRRITDVLKGLFLCNIYLECVSFSKRYVPEVINFLSGVLYLASENSSQTIHLVPPFKTKSKWSELLRIKPEERGRDVAPRPFVVSKALIECDSEQNDSLQWRIGALHMALHLANKFVNLYQDFPAFKEIFTPIKDHLKRIPINLYPDAVKDSHMSVLQQITSIENQPRKHLTLHTRKPEPLKSFTPKFQEHYEIKSKRAKQGGKKTNEQQKLKYKLKRELKGAIREVRKDSQFLSRQKLQDQLERDAERMLKVKQIEHLLSNEQAEVNELNRKRRKIKKR